MVLLFLKIAFRPLTWFNKFPEVSHCIGADGFSQSLEPVLEHA